MIAKVVVGNILRRLYVIDECICEGANQRLLFRFRAAVATSLKCLTPAEETSASYVAANPNIL